MHVASLFKSKEVKLAFRNISLYCFRNNGYHKRFTS